MSESNEYYQEWVAIESLTITNFVGKTADLLPYFLMIDIQEDIYVPVVSGNLTIIDTANFYEDFPIIGEEIITIKYKDFYSDSVTRTFAIYGCSERHRSTEKGTIYILNFCSEELLQNRITTYSKSYKNKLPHEIFNDAFNRVNPTKPINIQPTVELQDYIVPTMYPFDVCSQMAARSISAQGHVGSYLFFEDKDQFNFISIEKLIEGAPIEYKIGDANLAGIKNPKYIFKNYKYHKPINNVDNMMSGAQGVEMKELDLINRKLGDNSYDHFGGDYTSIKRVNSENPDLKMTSSKYKYKSNKGLYKVIIKPEADNAKSSKNKTLSKRYNILSSYMNGPKIHGELPFNAELTVGKMVKVLIPQINAYQQDSIAENDIYIQGKYIITALRQIIYPDHGETVVELAKDTYTESHDENVK